MADDQLAALCEAYGDERYPADFTSGFSLMECLAERPGVDTFLVQDKAGTSYIAKCYDLSTWEVAGDDIAGKLDHAGIPKLIASFKGDSMVVMVREYVEGTPLDRYAHDNDLSEQEIVGICVQLCDILAYLHHRDKPIIHRDIKPQNVIVKPDGSVTLIDFDIARVFQEGSETDTRFFGTLAYAPPEQYGFAQTDVRADIYSLGVLLRYLLTGSPRDNKNVRVSRPLEKVIAKCTAFDPQNRYADIDQVKRALLRVNPRARGLRIAALAIVAALVLGLAVYGGVRAYEALTYSPFSGDHTPAIADDEEAIAEAVDYLKKTYGTNLFDNVKGQATVGLLRQTLMDLYGFDRDFVYAHQADGELPGESDKWFMPWGWDDNQLLDRDYTVYAAVKAHDPSIVAEDQWSKLKDDTGEYPGARVAVMYADEHGITKGVGRPLDITIGEMALVFANTDRVMGPGSGATSVS